MIENLVGWFILSIVPILLFLTGIWIYKKTKSRPKQSPLTPSKIVQMDEERKQAILRIRQQEADRAELRKKSPSPPLTRINSAPAAPSKTNLVTTTSSSSDSSDMLNSVVTAYALNSLINSSSHASTTSSSSSSDDDESKKSSSWFSSSSDTSDSWSSSSSDVGSSSDW